MRLDACGLGCGGDRGTKGGHGAASAAAEGKIERPFRTTETGLETLPEDILLFVNQDAFETGATSAVPNRGDAPGPWRIGGGNDAGTHLLDASGEGVATIWKTPSRSVSALEAI